MKLEKLQTTHHQISTQDHVHKKIKFIFIKKIHIVTLCNDITFPEPGKGYILYLYYLYIYIYYNYTTSEILSANIAFGSANIQ